MIVDSFLFFNEFDLLELRLRELNASVDWFILVESKWTFSGKPKPLYFSENRSRFSPWLSKLLHLSVEMDVMSKPGWSCPLTSTAYFSREAGQRNEIQRALSNLSTPWDTVLISDLDEIPNPEVIKEYSQRRIREPHMLKQRFSYYYINCVTPFPWYGSRVMTGAHALTHEPEIIRHTNYPVVENGGWHISYAGGAAAISEKIQAFAHQEYNLPQYTDIQAIQKRMAGTKDIFDRDFMQFKLQPLDSTYPRALLENQEQFANFIHKG